MDLCDLGWLDARYYILRGACEWSKSTRATVAIIRLMYEGKGLYPVCINIE